MVNRRTRHRRGRMRGGVWPFSSNEDNKTSSIFGSPAQPAQPASDYATGAFNNVSSGFNYATGALSSGLDKLKQLTYGSETDSTKGGRCRRQRHFYGGNGNGVDVGLGSGNITPSMYKYGSDAAEVNDIQMAQPNTLVGGRRRRRRRRSSRSRGRSVRRSRRRSSRRN